MNRGQQPAEHRIEPRTVEAIPQSPPTDDSRALVALIALGLEPLAREVREQVAQAIDSAHDAYAGPTYGYGEGYRDGLDLAARIARGDRC